MDMVWFGKQKISSFKLRKNLGEAGQTAVEYILLFAVISALVLTIFKSDAFQKVFGKDSVLFQTFAKRIQYTYRHGVNLENDNAVDNSGYTGDHHTYFKGGQSRFYLPRGDYE